MKYTKEYMFFRQNAYPYYAEEKDRNDDDWQDSAYRAILHSLPTDALQEMVGRFSIDRDCPDPLLYKALRIYQNRQSCMHGKSTSTLLKWYLDKKSRKVVAAAKALMKRFPQENEENRRAILKAFLQGGIKEMEWAARYLRFHWTRSMTTVVGYRWKKTQTPVLAQLVLKHMPESFVWAEQERLAASAGYAQVCVRLGKRKDFHIDGSRLTPLEHLYALAKSGASHVDQRTVETRLSEFLDRQDWVSNRDLGLILWCLGKLGFTRLIMMSKPRFEIRSLMSEIAAGLQNPYNSTVS